MRRAAKVDVNQAEIVSRLRAAGWSVQSLSATGAGVPDLLCGKRGINVLLEVKDGAKVPSKQALTDDQEKWHAAWTGQVAVVACPLDALAACEGHLLVWRR